MYLAVLGISPLGISLLTSTSGLTCRPGLVAVTNVSYLVTEYGAYLVPYLYPADADAKHLTSVQMRSYLI